MLNIKSLTAGCLILFVCSSFIGLKLDSDSQTQSFELQPNQEFVFGEFTFEKAKFKVFNSSSEDLQIKILDVESLEPHAIIPFEAKTRFKAYIFPWEKVVIQNPTDEKVSILVDSKKLDSGFRIQEMKIHAD